MREHLFVCGRKRTGRPAGVLDQMDGVKVQTGLDFEWEKKMQKHNAKLTPLISLIFFNFNILQLGTINADILTALATTPGGIPLNQILTGGAGNDTLTGSDGNDWLLGGEAVNDAVFEVRSVG